jgi:hypothetical protein
MKIGIIDGTGAALRNLENILAQKGHKTEFFTEPADGLYLNSGNYDLMICKNVLETSLDEFFPKKILEAQKADKSALAKYVVSEIRRTSLITPIFVIYPNQPINNKDSDSFLNIGKNVKCLYQSGFSDEHALAKAITSY